MLAICGNWGELWDAGNRQVLQNPTFVPVRRFITAPAVVFVRQSMLGRDKSEGVGNFAAGRNALVLRTLLVTLFRSLCQCHQAVFGWGPVRRIAAFTLSV